MQISGVNRTTFESVVQRVSERNYNGNIAYAHTSDQSDTRFRGRIVAKASRGAGTRRSWSGRRGPWACWHVTRDVLTEFFNENPDAKVTTSMAKYIGKAGFLSEYPATAYINIGSMVSPAYMDELCDCDD